MPKRSGTTIAVGESRFTCGYRCIELGRDRFQAVVPAGCWQAAETVDPTWALAGCTVAPPFRFDAFELAGPELADLYPEHAGIVARLLRS